MGLFNLGNQLLKTAARTITLPVSVVKDVVTLGGVLTDEPEPSTLRHLKKLVKDVEDIPESID